MTAASVSARAERAKIKALLTQLEKVLANRYQASKWPALIEECLAGNGILPGNGEQAVVFTEYADSANWIIERLREAGFTAQVYSGRMNNDERDEVRRAFMRREFQIIVSTDAGQRGHRPAVRARPRQLRHPLVPGPTRAAHGPDPPCRPAARRRAV